MNTISLMYVAFGGAAGAMCRFAITDTVGRFNTTSFPVGTLAVNILGSLLLGMWLAVAASMLPSKAKDLHLLFAVGALGGFTTFSAFSLDAYLLMERGLHTQAFFYVFGSVVLSVLALLAGMWMFRTILG
jgi:CrcB protein